MRAAFKGLASLVVVTLVLGQMVFVPVASAAASFTGGPDQAPLYVMNDHTPVAIHFTASGLETNTAYYVKVRFCPNPAPGGGNQWGYTWNPISGSWVQERDSWTLCPQATTNASGEITSSAGWVFAKYGYTATPGGTARYVVISLSKTGTADTMNSSVTPLVTVMDPTTSGSWAHNGASTGAQASKKAEITSDTASGVVYSLSKTETNTVDDDSSGATDDEDYGPAGKTGDFRFGVPSVTSLDVRLNQNPWAMGDNFVSGPADVDIAIGAADTSAPAAPAGLTAAGGNGSVDLSWDAASDNPGGSGLAGYCVYRWTDSGSPNYTNSHSKIATVTSGESYTDSTVVNGTAYHYEVRSYDTSTNVSARSNTADATPDGTAPAAVTDLAGSSSGTETATLIWTAPGDDGSAGTASAYDIRYSTSPISDDSSFDAATQATGIPSPQVAGSAEAFTVLGLTEGQHYFFGLKTRDEASNWSGLSNIAETTPTAPPSGIMAVNNGASVTATANATVDSTVTGATEMRIRNAGDAWPGTWQAYSASVAHTLATGDGDKTVEAQYRNDIGGVLERSDTITLDTGVPSGTMGINSGATYTKSRNVTIDSTITGATEMRDRNAGGNWSAWEPYAPSVEHTVPAGDGAKTVEAEYRDNGSNVLPLSDDIILDTTPPSGTMSVNNQATYATTAGVTLDSTVTGASEMCFRDSGGTWSDWEAYSATRSWTLPGADGDKAVEAQYRDAAGNVLPLSDSVALDTAAPSGTMSVNGGASHTSTTTATLGSGVLDAVEMRFRDAGGTWSDWEAYAGSCAWTLPAGDGLKAVEAQYRDAAGNVLPLFDDIILDTVPPSGALAINGGASHTATAAVTLNSAMTGATQMRFRNTGGSYSAWEVYAGSCAWTLPSGDGVKAVSAQYRDAAGNVRSTYDTITLDTVAPSGTLKINDGTVATASRNVTLNSAMSGAAQMRFRDAGGAWSAWQAYATTRAWTLPAGDGQKVVSAQYRDAAGNIRYTYDTITLDTVAPAGTFSINGGSASTSSRNVTLVSAMTGATQMRFRNSGGVWSAWQTYSRARGWWLPAGAGRRVVSAQYRDAAGNLRYTYDTIVLQ